MQLISSIKHPLIIEARGLNKPAARLHSCLIEGAASIVWALDAAMDIQHVFISKDDVFEDSSLLDRLSADNIEIYHCSSGIMKKINESKYLTPIIAVAKISNAKSFSASNFILMLDDLQDQGNIGAIIRTAAAFGLHDVLTVGRSKDIFNKKTITASRGQVFHVNSTNYDEPLTAIKQLKKQGYQIIATSPRGEQLQSIAKLEKKPIALIVGNETNGSTDAVLKQADITVQIPMQDDVESLNVAVATGISVYELKLKVIIAMLTKYIKSIFGRELGVTHQLVQAAFAAELKKITTYSTKQVILLMIMVCDCTMTLSQIEKDTACCGEDLDKLLQPLLTDNFIVCSDDKYSVTAMGEELLGKIWVAVERSEAKVFAGFSETEKQTIKDMLKRIQDNCKTVS